MNWVTIPASAQFFQTTPNEAQHNSSISTRAYLLAGRTRRTLGYRQYGLRRSIPDCGCALFYALDSVPRPMWTRRNRRKNFVLRQCSYQRQLVAKRRFCICLPKAMLQSSAAGSGKTTLAILRSAHMLGLGIS
jgi:hypothetical protein